MDETIILQKLGFWYYYECESFPSKEFGYVAEQIRKLADGETIKRLVTKVEKVAKKEMTGNQRAGKRKVAAPKNTLEFRHFFAETLCS